MKSILRALMVTAFAGLFIAGELHAGNLKVNLAPTQAVNAGAQWRVDGGTWKNSGASVNGLSNGTHQVTFQSVNGWIAPAAANVTITNGTTTFSYTYVQAASLKVTLSPGTAQWRVDGGAWQASAATVANLAPGTHTVDYAALSGYTAPTSESVTLTAGQLLAINRSYAQLAQVTVTLSPGTAQWRVDGGAWRNSGTTAANLSPGNHTIEYGALPGYAAPAQESVTLAAGQSLPLSRTYVQLAQVTVTLSPASASFRVDGGAWQNSGLTVANLSPGSHVIDYAALPGYVAPASESIALTPGQSLSISRNYTQLAQLTVTLTPSSGQWRVDGGAWNASGATLAGLSTGAHLLEYSPLPDYSAPPTESVNLAGGANGLARGYVQHGSLTVLLDPAAGRWRVDAGPWQIGGATVPGLSAGDHTVDYLDLASYTRPPAESVTILPGSTATLARAYVQHAELGIAPSPSSASRVGIVAWRVNGGSWLSPATRVSVPPSSYLIEFKPAAGWEVPAPVTATPAAGQLTEVPGEYHPVHRLRFFIHENLAATVSPAELQARLGQYAGHIQQVFHRETVRRFTFDAAADITLCSASPFSGVYTGTVPQTGFEVWVYAQLTDNPTMGTYGGSGSIDASGAGGATGLRWDAIHDPATLQPDTPQLRQYWTQIDHIVHELEHTFGAGIGEYYSPLILADPTDVAPILATTSFVQPDPNDHFWGTREEYWCDPLTVNIYDHWRADNPKSLPDLLARVAFAPVTKAVIADLRRSDLMPTIPSLASVNVRVIDAVTGLPIPGASLRIWNRRNYNSSFEQTVSAGASPGLFTFLWTPYPHVSVFGNFDNMKILKAWAPGYVAKAQWEWIFDAQGVKLIDGASSFDLTIALTPQ